MPIDPGTAILAGAGISTLGGLIGGGKSGKKTDQTAAAMLAIAELQQRFAEEERDFMRGTVGGARQQLMNYLEMPAEERALPTLRSGSSALAEAYRAEQDALDRQINRGGLQGGQASLARVALADKFARARADVYSQGLQRAQFTEPLAAMGLYRGIDPGQTLQASAQTLGQLGNLYGQQQQGYLQAISQGLGGLGYWLAQSGGGQRQQTGYNVGNPMLSGGLSGVPSGGPSLSPSYYGGFTSPSGYSSYSTTIGAPSTFGGLDTSNIDWTDLY